MDDSLPQLLQARRTARGVSLGSLSLRTDIHKSTLSRWESGKQQPRVTQLETVLDALGVVGAARKNAIALLATPRALTRLRTITQSENTDFVTAAGQTPSGGDLLRAMRLRKGWKLEEAAHSIGAQASAISRWERSESWPAIERLHALCYALGAHEAEIAALTYGPFAFGGAPPEPLDVETLYSRFKAFYPYDETLIDLFFLSMETHAWNLAMRQEQARPILMQIYSQHALYLTNQKRYGEADGYTQRVFDIKLPHLSSIDGLCDAIIASAQVAAFGGKRPQPRRGYAVLRNWIDSVDSPAYRGWMLSDSAKYQAQEGDMESALALNALAREEAKRADPVEMRCRQRDQAQLLLWAGRPHETLRVIADYSHIAEEPRSAVRDMLLATDALLAMNDRDAAHTQLQSIYGTLATYNFVALRAEADALGARL